MQLKKYTNSKYITCGNGTDALQVALLSIENSSNNYVICPSFTFVSTAGLFLYQTVFLILLMLKRIVSI